MLLLFQYILQQHLFVFTSLDNITLVSISYIFFLILNYDFFTNISDNIKLNFIKLHNCKIHSKASFNLYFKAIYLLKLYKKLYAKYYICFST